MTTVSDHDSIQHTSVSSKEQHSNSPLGRSPPRRYVISRQDEELIAAKLVQKGIIAIQGPMVLTRKDLETLNPGGWLNDSIIDFYGSLISNRAKRQKKSTAESGRGGEILDIHIFSVFFWATLRGYGYEHGRMSSWTKKVRNWCVAEKISTNIDDG